MKEENYYCHHCEKYLGENDTYFDEDENCFRHNDCGQSVEYVGW